MGYVNVIAEGRMTVGEGVIFLGGMIPSQIICRQGGDLAIGSSSGFNYGAAVECSQSIQIGKRCMFGSMTYIRDCSPDRKGSVVIEDDVWVAYGAVIEPGTRVGMGSVVGAGSVVTSDVPPRSLAIGNPARSVSLEFMARHDTNFCPPAASR
jgi:maltose O-acetyltransferase